MFDEAAKAGHLVLSEFLTAISTMQHERVTAEELVCFDHCRESAM